MRTLSVATFLMVLSTGPVLAQSGECSCEAPLPAGPVLGEVAQTSGQVLVSNNGEMTEAVAGSPIRDGSQVVLGPSSNATLGLGSCSMSVGENSAVDVFGANGAMCVRVEGMPTTAAIGDNPGLWVPLGASAGFAVGSAVAAELTGEDQVSGGDTGMSP